MGRCFRDSVPPAKETMTHTEAKMVKEEENGTAPRVEDSYTEL